MGDSSGARSGTAKVPPPEYEPLSRFQKLVTAMARQASWAKP